MQPRRGSAGDNLNNAVTHANKAVKSFGNFLSTSINNAATNVANNPAMNSVSPQKALNNIAEIFNPSSGGPEQRRLFHNEDGDFFDNEDADDVLEVLENERFDPQTKSWSSQHLSDGDPKRFKSAGVMYDDFPDLSVPVGWSFVGDWEVDVAGEFVLHDWRYSTNFLEMDLQHYFPKSEKTLVRRKRWIRRIESNEVDDEDLGDEFRDATYQRQTEASVETAEVASSPPEVRSRSNTDSKSPPPSPIPEVRSRSNTATRTTPPINPFSKSAKEAPSSPLPTAETSHSATSTNTNTTGATLEDHATLLFEQRVATVEVEENFEFEYEDDSNKDTESVTSDVSYIKETTSSSYFSSSTSSSNMAPAKKRSSWFGGSSSTTSTTGQAVPAAAPAAPEAPKYVTDPCLKIQSTTLNTLGKQLKFIENECKKEEEMRIKNWKDNVKPKLEATIADLERRANGIKAMMERDIAKGADHLNLLEDELNSVNEKLDEHKRRLYFPFSNITLGQAGVYLAIEDFWLEYASGGFSLDLLPDKTSPRIILKLTGTQNNAEGGVDARLQVEGFKLAGDKGKGVPKLKFDVIKVTIALTASVMLEYNMKASKWQIDPKNFRISILSFKGPYGLNRSIVSMVLSLLTPMIRNLLIQHLPYELGLLIRTFPTPFSLRGEFDFQGVDLNLMHTEWHKSAVLGKMMNYSPIQLEMFYWLQKALDRSQTMKTVAELMAYMTTYSKNPGIWFQLANLWTQATKLYCEKVTLAKNDGQYASNNFTDEESLTLPAYTIHFEEFKKACDDLSHKRISVSFKLYHIDGQLTVNHKLNFTYQIAHKLTTDAASKATNVKKVQLLGMIDQMKKNYDMAVEALKLVASNLDFAQLSVLLNLQSGHEGLVKISVKDILAQAPLLLKLNILTDKNLGAIPLVPYIISFKPQENGDICLEFYHFTHDSSRIPMMVSDGNKNSTDAFLRESIANMGLSDTYRSASSLQAQLHSQQPSAPVVTKGNITNSVPDTNFTNYDNSIRTGCYSTSYNRTVDSIASGRVVPRTTFVDTEPASPPGTSKAREANSSIKHLLVKQEDLKRRLEHVLSDHPTGENADTVLSLRVVSPHIAMIVDQQSTLKPGSELFTVLVGPPKAGWKPFGTKNMFEDDDAENTTEKADASKPPGGVPIMVQSAPGIKLLAEIPKTDIFLHIPSLMRFILAHFADLVLLKSYIQILAGADIDEEILMVAKAIFEKLGKYLLLPGLNLDVNINGKVVTSNGEMMVRVETPADLDSKANSTIVLEAQVSLKEILEDVQEIEGMLRSLLGDAESTPASAAVSAPFDVKPGVPFNRSGSVKTTNG